MGRYRATTCPWRPWATLWTTDCRSFEIVARRGLRRGAYEIGSGFKAAGRFSPWNQPRPRHARSLHVGPTRGTEAWSCCCSPRVIAACNIDCGSPSRQKHLQLNQSAGSGAYPLRVGLAALRRVHRKMPAIDTDSSSSPGADSAGIGSAGRGASTGLVKVAKW